MGYLWAIFALGFLIAFHEFGHLVIAKLFGIGVVRYSIGFGKALFLRKYGDTEYAISLIPLGGYCRLVSISDPTQKVEDLSKTMESKPIWQQILVFLAGPIFNLSLAILLPIGAYAYYGLPKYTTKIGEVTADLPAAKAGLKSGDHILKVSCINEKDASNIESVVVDDWDKLVAHIGNRDCAKFNFFIARGNEPMTLEVIPLIVSDEKQIIGIGPAPPVFERDLRKAMRVGLEEVKTSSVLITKAFGKMFSGGVSKGSFKNPVQIVNMGAATYRYGGLFDLARLTGQMSFNLFIFNLIPFLFIVDGGQITFLIIQAVRGKPLRQGVRAFLQNVGFFFLLALLLMTFL